LGWTVTINNYVIIIKEIRNKLTNTKVLLGVHFGCDHCLLVAELIKMKYTRNMSTRVPRIKDWKFQDRAIQEKFREQLKEYVPTNEAREVEEEWERLKKKCKSNRRGMQQKF
jgi:hypothetical protein